MGFNTTARFLKRQRSNIIIYVMLICGCLTLYNSVKERNAYEIKVENIRKNEQKELANKPKVAQKQFEVAQKNVLEDKHRVEDVHEPTPLPFESTPRFTKDDMVDEYGNPFQIMIWTKGHGVPVYKANPQECLDYISCEISFKTKEPEKAHAVVFKFDDLHISEIPSKRTPSQLYAWWASESPMHSYVALKKANFFNLTFHYRTDADVYAPYGSVNLLLRELKTAGETDLEVLLEKKRRSGKMAAWAVSNCYEKRLDYGKSLMSVGLEVDTFGDCFDSKELGDGRYTESFYAKLADYKFYLSFENSIGCKDYFTEKFWYNGLRSGAVPIVWGPKKEDILKVAPTKSFIHTSDFENEQELVDYLNYLANNITAYAEYHEWRTWIHHPERIEERLRMENRDNDLRSFCKLCSILQEDGKRRKQNLPVQPRIIPSLSEAWHDKEQSVCRV